MFVPARRQRLIEQDLLDFETLFLRPTYQFAAMMALLCRLSFLDFGLCFTFDMEDLFFFFCNSRPIIAVDSLKKQKDVFVLGGVGSPEKGSR